MDQQNNKVKRENSVSFEIDTEVVIPLKPKDQINDRGSEGISSETEQKRHPRLSIVSSPDVSEFTEPDSPITYKNGYASKKNVAEGMMDIALLTANANQLRFLITFNSKSQTYYISLILIIISLILQVAVGIALIFKRQMKNRGKRNKISRMNDFLVGGVFIITVINVFVASFTTTTENTTT